MSDINLLPTGDQTRDEKETDAKKPAGDDMTLHVPTQEPAEKPAAAPLGGTFLSQLIETEKAASIPTEKLFSQKIEPIPAPPGAPAAKAKEKEKEIIPLKAPSAAPKPATVAPKPAVIAPVAPAASKIVPQPPPPPPKQPLTTPPSSDENGGGTLRVSLITANGAAGLSDLALRRRQRTFAVIGLLGVLTDGLIFGGLHLRKLSIEKGNTNAERAVQEIDVKIADREKALAPVRDFQALNRAAARVLDAHAHWTEVLKLLEERALPDVQFGSLAGAETGTLGFDLIARDYTTLAKQIVAFRQDPRVKKATVGTASADIGENGILKGVRATMTLTIDPSVFRFKPSVTTAPNL